MPWCAYAAVLLACSNVLDGVSRFVLRAPDDREALVQRCMKTGDPYRCLVDNQDGLTWPPLELVELVK
eukprot:7084599-Heterocapsa_arctica.AAC.1